MMKLGKNTLKSSKDPKPIPPNEAKALKVLKQNQKITILPGDKGNATVMNTTGHIAKKQQILENEIY